MGKQLAMYTTVGGDTFPAGTKVGDVVGGVKFTAEVAKHVTNAHAWGGSDDYVSADVDADVDADDTKPASVKDIVKEVGDDPEKARAYLEAEQAAEKPRSSLVDKLQGVIDAAAADDDED